MQNKFMELFEMQQSYREEKDDWSLDKNIFIRKIYLAAFMEYFVTFVASLAFQYRMMSWIVFYCFLAVSLGCQFYFEFQGEIRNENARVTQNYIYGCLSIVANMFSNYFIWSLLSIGTYGIWYGTIEKYLIFTEILLVMYVLMFSANISKTNFSKRMPWIISIVIPFLLQFIADIVFQSQFPLLFQTIVVIWLCIMMIMMTKEMKQEYGTPDEIFIHSCRLLGAPFQIIVYVVKFIIISHYSEDYLYQGNIKEKVAYLRKVGVTFYTITLVVIIFQISVLYCFECYQLTILINVSYSEELATEISFTLLYWISLGISLTSYLTLLVGHTWYHWVVNWILFVIQVIFFSFGMFGASWYLIYTNFQSNEMIYYLYEQAYSSLCGLAIGLLIYTFNMKENIFNNRHAVISMMFCPWCIWIVFIYLYAVEAPLFIAYSFGLFIFCLIYAVWISFEIEQQLNKKVFELKQYDYHIGSIQLFEPFFSIPSRIIALCF